VWNRTLAWRRQRYQAEKAGTTYAQASAYLTAMKTTEELAWLNEVSSVPLQQAIRHQQAAYTAFFAQRARYPRFKSRNGRQCAEYTRSGFRWRDGRLYLAKMNAPLAFAVNVPEPEPLPETGRTAGVDLGIIDMIRNRTLAKAIADCGWGTFRAMLAYKAVRYGRLVIIADRCYPSSKTCPSCGTRHDRDINAAKNILAAGLAVAEDHLPGHACGADVRHSGTSRVRSAVKQEPQGVSPGIPVLQVGE
jgi:transposase